MIKINLLPEEILAQAQARQRKIQAAAAGIVVGVIVGLVSYSHWSTGRRLEQKLAEQEAKLQELAAIVAQVEELERTAANVRSRLKVITDLMKGRPLYPAFMSDFVRAVPPGITIRDLTTATAADLSLGLTMNAEAGASSDIASWVKAMETSGKFNSPEMGAVAITMVEGRRSLTFSMTAKYVPKL